MHHHSSSCLRATQCAVYMPVTQTLYVHINVRVNQTYDTCIQASPEIGLERKSISGLLGGKQNHNLHNSGVTALTVSYQALGSKVVWWGVRHYTSALGA